MATMTFGLLGCSDDDEDINMLTDRIVAIENGQVQSLVYVPTTTDGRITIPEGTASQPVVITYMVQPVAMATTMAANRELLAFVVEEGLTTRAASQTATLTVSSISADHDGRLSIIAKSNGFQADRGYAIALNWNSAPFSYSSAYTLVRIKGNVALHDNDEDQNNAE